MENDKRFWVDPSLEFPGFVKFPRKLPELLTRHELTFHEFGLLAFLLAAANHRTHRWTGSLRSLQDQLRWPHGLDHLRKTLHVLRSEGWIEFTTRAGQRTPYELELTRQLRATGVRRRKVTAEVTSDADRSGQGDLPLHEPFVASPEPRSSRVYQEREVEGDRDLEGDFQERDRGLDTQRSEKNDEEIPF
jgi:hypothetical protein